MASPYYTMKKQASLLLVWLLALVASLMVTAPHSAFASENAVQDVLTLLEQALGRTISADKTASCTSFIESLKTAPNLLLAALSSRHDFQLQCGITDEDLRTLFAFVSHPQISNEATPAPSALANNSGEVLLSQKVKANLRAKMEMQALADISATASDGYSCPVNGKAPTLRYDVYYTIKLNGLSQPLYLAVSEARGGTERRLQPGLPLIFSADPVDSGAHWRFYPNTQILVNRKNALRLNLNGVEGMLITALWGSTDLEYICSTSSPGSLEMRVKNRADSGLRCGANGCTQGNGLFQFAHPGSSPTKSFTLNIVTKFFAPDNHGTPTISIRNEPMDKWVGYLSMALNLADNLKLGAGFVANIALGIIYPQPTVGEQLEKLSTEMLALVTQMIIDANIKTDFSKANERSNLLRGLYLREYMAQKYEALKDTDPIARNQKLIRAGMALYSNVAAPYEAFVNANIYPLVNGYGPTAENLKRAQQGFRLLQTAMVEQLNAYQEIIYLDAITQNNSTSCDSMLYLYNIHERLKRFRDHLYLLQEMLVSSRLGYVQTSCVKTQYTYAGTVLECKIFDSFLGDIYRSTTIDSSKFAQAEEYTKIHERLWKEELTFDIKMLSYNWENTRSFLVPYATFTRDNCLKLRQNNAEGEKYRKQFLTVSNFRF